MEDILSQGGDREPSRWPRRLAVIGAAVLAAVASIVYLSLGPPALSRRRSPAPVPPPPRPNRTGSPDLPCLGPAACGFRSRERSRPGSRPPRAVPRRSAACRPTAPATSSPAPAGAGWCRPVRRRAGMRRLRVPSLPVWFLADGARSATRVGTANQVTPAATAGRRVADQLPAGRRSGHRRADGAGGQPGRRAAGTAGQAPGRVRDLPGNRPRPAARAGQPAAGTPAYKLWNPADQKANRTFDGVIAASPAEIAWTPPCAATCRVQLLDLATGRQAVIELPAGSFAAGAAFSPSGGHLALQVMSDEGGGPSTRLEVASDGQRPADGRCLEPRSAATPWSISAGRPVGDTLVAEFVFPGKVQLASWHPGATGPAVAVIRPGQDQASLVVG